MTRTAQDKKVMGKTGLIGGSGLVGGAFLDPALELDVVTLGRNSSCNRHLDLDTPASSLVFDGLDTLVHAAGVRDEDFVDNPEKAFWRSGYGARNLFETACNAGVRSIIYISTAHVYGALEGNVTEEMPVAPATDYASSHYLTERILCRVAQDHNVRALVVRPNAVFGLTFDPARFSRWNLVPFLFPRFAAENAAIEVRHPAVMRNFISSRQIAHASVDALSMLETAGVTVLNAVGADDLTMGDYARLCSEVGREVAGRPIELVLAKSLVNETYTYRSNIAPMPEPKGELRDFVFQYMARLINAGATVTQNKEGSGP